MIKWTTPTLKCSIPEGIELDYILLTLSQGNITIEKTISSESIVDNAFSVFFTQEETGQFNKNLGIEAQLNIINGGTRLATNIVQLKISKNLHNEEIEDLPIISYNITENGTYDVSNYNQVVVNVESGLDETLCFKINIRVGIFPQQSFI